MNFMCNDPKSGFIGKIVDSTPELFHIKWYDQEIDLELNPHGSFEEKVTKYILYCEGIYNRHNLQKNGLHIYYYPNGNKKEEITYMNGMKNGIQINYDSNGFIYSKTTYRDDCRSGDQVIIYSDKMTHERKSYVDDMLHGYNEIYYSGKIKVKIPYVYGIKHGVEIQYDDIGRETMRYSWINGKISGVLNEFYPSGKLKLIIDYKDNQVHGNISVYNEEGVLIGQKKFRDGIEITS